jgi:chemotaxis protein histidine kinase CheA
MKSGVSSIDVENLGCEKCWEMGQNSQCWSNDWPDDKWIRWIAMKTLNKMAKDKKELEEQKLEEQKLEEQKLEEQKLEELELENKMEKLELELEELKLELEEQKLEEQKLEEQKLEKKKLEELKLELEEQKLENQKLEKQKLKLELEELEKQKQKLELELEEQKLEEQKLGEVSDGLNTVAQVSNKYGSLFNAAIAIAAHIPKAEWYLDAYNKIVIIIPANADWYMLEKQSQFSTKVTSVFALPVEVTFFKENYPNSRITEKLHITYRRDVPDGNKQPEEWEKLLGDHLYENVTTWVQTTTGFTLTGPASLFFKHTVNIDSPHITVGESTEVLAARGFFLPSATPLKKWLADVGHVCSCTGDMCKCVIPELYKGNKSPITHHCSECVGACFCKQCTCCNLHVVGVCSKTLICGYCSPSSEAKYIGKKMYLVSEDGVRVCKECHSKAAAAAAAAAATAAAKAAAKAAGIKPSKSSSRRLRRKLKKEAAAAAAAAAEDEEEVKQ